MIKGSPGSQIKAGSLNDSGSIHFELRADVDRHIRFGLQQEILKFIHADAIAIIDLSGNAVENLPLALLLQEYSTM